jgi:hypothetical protein
MRTSFLCGAWLFGFSALGLVLSISSVARADATANVNDRAAALVQQALKAEAEGKPDERADLLQQAMAIAPDYAPAHWQAGETRADEKWSSIDDATKHDPRSAKLEEYRQLRDQTAKTVESQLELARWCEKAGLKEQQQAHLMFALQMEPSNKEVRSKLGLVRYGGRLVPAGQVNDIKANSKQSWVEAKEWKTRVDKWRWVLQEGPKSSREDVLKQIREVREPGAISAMETALSHSGKDACLAAIEAFAAMPQQSATDALVRAALYSMHDDVSREAMYALRSRSPFGYVPLLIAALQAPIKVEYDVLNLDPNNFTHQLRLSRQYADHEDVRIDYASSTTTSPLVTVGQGSMRSAAPADTSAMQTMKTAAKQQAVVRRMVNKVQEINDETAASNAKLTGLLRETTGQELSADATAWWDWWYDYNGYYRPEEMPVNYSGSSSNTYSVNPRYQFAYNPPSASPSSRSECFVAGTTVWTMTGPMPIENVKVGELVLSQNPDTGELAYKAVIDTTFRPKSAVVATQLGSTVIVSTVGHPFWVSGKGWQMAKELQAGQWLHTVHGGVKIDAIEPSVDAVCYNLVVADFHDYFVSDAKVLVHDNLLRGPTMSTVPGLAEAQ